MAKTETKIDVEQSFFVFVRDTITGKIKRIAIPSDVQIGLQDNPSELHLTGRFSLAVGSYDASTATRGTFNIKNHDTIVNVLRSSTISGITASLPSNPRNGQLHFIKDSSGTAGSTSISILPVTGVLIDGSAAKIINTAYGSLALYWFHDQWKVLISSTGGAGGGAPTDATYITISSNATLTNERTLTAGSGISIVDNGANSTVVVSATGSPVGGGDPGASYVVMGLTASLSNERVLTAGPGISISDGGANAAVTISSIVRESADVSASYLVVGVTGSLPNERALAAGPGISFSDGGAGGAFTISSVVRESADVSASYITVGNTGSLPNERALIAGSGISIVDNGANSTIVISATGTGSAGGGGADVSASYVVIGLTSSLPNERALTAGAGISIVDSGPGGSVTVSLSTVSSQSATAYHGYTTASVWWNQTGSWTPFFSGTQGHFVDSISNSITRNSSSFSISNVGNHYFHASFNVYGSDAYVSLRLSGSSGVVLQRSTYRTNPLDQNPIVLDGIFTAASGSSWLLEYIASGTVYAWTGSNPLVDGDNMRTGEIAIFKIADPITVNAGGTDVSASYVTIGNTGSLPNERALTAGTGISIVDGGSGGQVIVSLATASVYDGFCTGSKTWTGTATWTDVITPSSVVTNFTDVIQLGITRSGSTFQVTQTGYYQYHSYFVGGRASGYVAFRLSGSNGTIIQQTSYDSGQSMLNGLLYGVFQLDSGSNFKLQYVTKVGSDQAWGVNDPIGTAPDSENMRTGHISILKIS
jgi:hypothetical protein